MELIWARRMDETALKDGSAVLLVQVGWLGWRCRILGWVLAAREDESRRSRR